MSPLRPRLSPRFRFGLGVLFLTFGTTAAGPALAESFQFHFSHEFTWHGIPVYKMETKGLIENGTYRLDFDNTTLGLFDAILAFTSHATSTGTFDGERVRPQYYKSRARMRGEDRHVTIDYGADGPAKLDVDPPPEKDDRDPVLPWLETDTIDPLSAAFLMSALMANGAPCTQTVPIFDGRMRYNLHFEYLGTDTLHAGDGEAYDGPTIKCRVTIERIAGFLHKTMAQPPRPPSILWVARLADGHLLVPVKLESTTNWGDVVGTLEGFAIGRADDTPAKAPIDQPHDEKPADK